MNAQHAAPAALWFVSCALGVAAIASAAPRADRNVVTAPSAVRAPGLPAVADPAVLQQQADSLRLRNPFRIERAPTSQPFGAPEAAQLPVDVEAPPRRPVLVLGGIVGGPPWKAVVEGIPGQESGVLLGAGEEWNGFRVKWVRRDSVMVVTPDTTLILALKQVWR